MELTSRGTVWDGLAKFVSLVDLVLVSFTAWKAILGNRRPSSPMHPGTAFPAASVVVSKLCRYQQAETKQETFDDQLVLAYSGLGTDPSPQNCPLWKRKIPA
ncbi:hypothetical protein [Burkholderia territorii]|uniref:hypothetical protein n=1 Tax=Burkholderia territorii TaxID=1503055 RepID=UPI0012D95C89|nr:hypothetical protein [Burkholderia territorii]